MPTTPTVSALSPDTVDERLSSGAIRRRAAAAVLVAAATVVAARLAGLILRRDGADPIQVGSTYPISGYWRHGLNAWLLFPLLAAVVLCWGWPRLVGRLRWPRMLATATVAATGWACALALADGPSGFTDPLASHYQYPHDVPKVHQLGSFFATFNDYVVHHHNGLMWTTHVGGHPPGVLLVFVLADRIGLGGLGTDAAICVLGGALAVPCVLTVIRRFGGEDFARRAAVFVPLAPAALWVASTADALFAGVAAAGLCALVCAAQATGRRSDVYAAAGGLALGCCLYLSYGLALLVIPAVGLVLAGRWDTAAGPVASLRRSVRPLLIGGVVVLALLGAGRLAGYDWWQGLQLAAQRTHAGVWQVRPTWYFVLANPACLLICVGPVVVAGLALVRRCRVAAVAACAALAVAGAIVSNLSKGEVERIYLPFAVWLLPFAATLITRPRGRAAFALLAVQLGWTVLITVVIKTKW